MVEINGVSVTVASDGIEGRLPFLGGREREGGRGEGGRGGGGERGYIYPKTSCSQNFVLTAHQLFLIC